VGCAVEMGGTIHCISPLGSDNSGIFQVGFYAGSRGCGRQTSMVDQEGLVLNGCIGNELIATNLVTRDVK